MKARLDEQEIWRVPNESGTNGIFIVYKDFDGEIPLHWHSFYEIEIIVEGSGEHVLNGESCEVGRGAAYLLSPTDFHTLKATTPMKLWHIPLNEDMISDRRVFDLSATIQKSFALDEETLRRLCSLAEVLRCESALEDGCTCELCDALLRILLRNIPRKAETDLGRYDGIRKALLYMSVHFRENPSLSTVAAQAGFHPHYFSELFRDVTGQGYVERLNSLKIAYAKSLLDGGFTVGDTCYQSGFGSLSNFLTVFKRTVGASPDEYRRRKNVINIDK